MIIRLGSRTEIRDRIICFFFIFPFCHATQLGSILHINWNYLFLIDSVAILVVYLYIVKKMARFFFVLIAFYLSIILSTIINNRDVFYACAYCTRIVFFVLLIEIYVKNRKTDILISTIKFLLGVYILINVVIQFVHQDLFGYAASGNVLNFLDHDNQLGYWYISFILIVYLSDCKKSKWYRTVDLSFWSIICLISLVRAWSATCMVIYALFIICLYFRYLKFFRFFSPGLSIVTNIGVTVLVIFFRIQNLFRYFIENILHKDLNFSARTIIWTSAIKNILKKPFIGYGFGDKGRLAINLNIHGGYSFSHNIFLEILIEGGCLAFLLYICIHLIAGSAMRRCKESDLMNVINISLFCLLLMQFSEFALYNPFANLPLILCFFYNELLNQGYGGDDNYSVKVFRICSQWKRKPQTRLTERV